MFFTCHVPPTQLLTRGAEVAVGRHVAVVRQRQVLQPFLKCVSLVLETRKLLLVRVHLVQITLQLCHLTHKQDTF